MQLFRIIDLILGGGVGPLMILCYLLFWQVLSFSSCSCTICFYLFVMKAESIQKNRLSMISIKNAKKTPKHLVIILFC